MDWSSPKDTWRPGPTPEAKYTKKTGRSAQNLPSDEVEGEQILLTSEEMNERYRGAGKNMTEEERLSFLESMMDF